MYNDLNRTCPDGKVGTPQWGDSLGFQVQPTDCTRIKIVVPCYIKNQRNHIPTWIEMRSRYMVRIIINLLTTIAIPRVIISSYESKKCL